MKKYIFKESHSLILDSFQQRVSEIFMHQLLLYPNPDGAFIMTEPPVARAQVP